VGFRYFVRERALALGLSGWVKNRSDGSVELIAAGDERAVSQLLDEVRQGPPRSAVEAIEEVEPIASVDVETSPLPTPFAVVRE
jgi:acylphosphatase